MHFPLDNSVCRVETTCPLVRLDNLDAVPSQLMRCIFHSTTYPLVQILKSIFHSYMSTVMETTAFPLSDFLLTAMIVSPSRGSFIPKRAGEEKKDSSGHWINFRQSFNNQTGKQMILLSLDKMALHINVTQRYTYS